MDWLLGVLGFSAVMYLIVAWARYKDEAQAAEAEKERLNEIVLSQQGRIKELLEENSILRDKNSKAAESKDSYEKKQAEADQAFFEAMQLKEEYQNAFDNISGEVLKSLMVPLEMPQKQKNAFIDAFYSDIGHRALTEEKTTFKDIYQLEYTVISQSGNTYKTSLHSCTCEYHQKKHKICKHMLALALELGVIRIDRESLYRKNKELIEENYKLIADNKKLQKKNVANNHGSEQKGSEHYYWHNGKH